MSRPAHNWLKEEEEESQAKRHRLTTTDAESNKEIYRWEGSFVQSWKFLSENENGLLNIEDIEKAKFMKRRKFLKARDPRIVRRGLTRCLYLVLDFSTSIALKDLRPNRMAVTLKATETFIKEYFDQNPISQMGVIVTRNSRSEKVIELSGNPIRIIDSIKRFSSNTGGEPSLQNSLEMARIALCHVPKYASREVLVVFSSLNSCDPGDIHQTIDALKVDSVRCSVISLSAETFICKKLTKETIGTFGVALNEDHFKELLLQHTPPPPSVTAASKVQEACLIRMGFPEKRTESTPSLCSCHNTLVYGGYPCPQCGSKLCELPIDCTICGLTLVSSPHIARSYHHLFPAPNFLDSMDLNALSQSEGEFKCFSCLFPFPHSGMKLRCPRCEKAFCIECDAYIHESLHNCPGCEMIQGNKKSENLELKQFE